MSEGSASPGTMGAGEGRFDRLRELRAAVVETLGEVQQHLLRVDPSGERLEPDVPASDGARHVVGQLEAEAALAQTARGARARSRCARGPPCRGPQGQGGETLVGGASPR